uniref:E3 ubiquitin-protein ligase n=1 Tax=Mesocestoides corti TaxID=53468 RepID=A0A5K3G2E2_MESCO
MVRSLHNLIESARLAKTTSSSNSGSSGQSAGVRFIATLVHSLLTHYRPPRWADLPEGLQAMEHLKDAHMITLRHLLSCEQSSWVAREVSGVNARMYLHQCLLATDDGVLICQ